MRITLNQLKRIIKEEIEKDDAEEWARLAARREQSLDLEKQARESTSPKELDRLAHSEFAQVHWFVARNPHTSGETLRYLGTTGDLGIKKQVALNPSTPPDLLASFVDTLDGDNLLAVAGNPSTPPEALEVIFNRSKGTGPKNKGRDSNALRALARNPSTPDEIKSWLRSSRIPWMGDAFARKI